MQRGPRVAKERESSVAIEFIYRNAMGNPVILQSVPTNATMKANTWGVYGTDIYIKFANNVTLKVTKTNVA